LAELRFDISRLGKAERTPSGGVKVPAALTRVGIFEYRRADGTTQLEFRPPEEVFRDDSLKSFDGAAVTVGHPPGGVSADNWSSLAKGHVVENSVRRDGAHVASALTIQDGSTIARVDSGELCEISLGYAVDYDPTPGEYEGRRYDGVQRNIRGNHVALLPKGAGRAGPDCALRLDSSAAVCELPENAGAQLPAEKDTMKIRLDGKEYEYGSAEHIAAERADAAKTASTETLVKANARADQAEADLAKEKAKVLELSDSKRFDAAVASAVALRVAAATVLGTEFKCDGKTAREIQIAVIKADAKDFTGEGKDDAYVSARFDLVVEKGTRADSVLNVPAVVERARTDASQDSENADSEKAAKEMRERNRNAWKTPAPAAVK
jgi:hypothetical protein